MKLPANRVQATLGRMNDWLAEMSLHEARAWESAMLDHPFDQDDWAAARNLLLSHLEKTGKTAGEASLRSYLCCCAESTGGVHPLPSLASLADEFYREHGMEGAEEALP